MNETELIKFLKENGITSVIVSVNLGAATVTPPVTPPAPVLEQYRINKPGGRVKLRPSPSPAVDGPVVAHGVKVLFTGHTQKAYAINWMEVMTTDAVPLKGWAEDKYLVKA